VDCHDCTFKHRCCSRAYWLWTRWSYCSRVVHRTASWYAAVRLACFPPRCWWTGSIKIDCPGRV